MKFPLITLLTDFGAADTYVAAMKLAILKRCPTAQLIDITHAIPPQDILAGSIALERAIASAPPGTIHLAVIDPGVGSNRKILIAQIAGQQIICPDNGLITWPLHRHGRGAKPAVRSLTTPPNSAAPTFHGRDIMAPLAADLANRRSLSARTRPLSNPILLDIDLAKPAPIIQGQIIQIDHFGNATTNIPSNLLKKSAVIRIAARAIPLHQTYTDVSPNKPLALIGSSDLLEIAVRNNSAARLLHLRVGDKISVSRPQ